MNATQLATALLGDAIGANLFVVGYALQKGLIPVGLPALERAIELNGRAIEMNKRARQPVTVREGLDKDLARKMVKLIKDSKLKVQAAIQGEQLRVTGKKRDDLQQIMQNLREAGLGIPLQFNNFRD